MSRTNFFLKYLKNISSIINSLLEKNLNKLNFQNISFLLRNNKIILIFVAVFVLFVSYLLLPTFYNQSDLSSKLKTELEKKFNLNFNFSQKLKYNIFPKPHFITENSVISGDKRETSKINNLKIYISFKNLLTLKNIQIQNLIIEKANFNLNKNNYNLFLNLMSKNFRDTNLIIEDSNIFFRSLDDEVLFINKIIKLKYSYDQKEIKNVLYSENEIFNIPFSMEIFFNEDKSEIFSNININLINLKIENKLSLNEDKKIGKVKFFLNKSKQIADYKIEKNSLKFYLFDKKDQPSSTYKGDFYFKPFYSIIEGEVDELNLNLLFGSNAIVAQLLKTEILNNKNIDFKFNIKADRILNNFYFRDINFKSKIQDGLIDTDKTEFKWKNFADFELLQSLIFVKNGELVLDGKIMIYVKNYNDIYKFLLTPKKYRKEINQIDLNFTYNFDKNTATLKDIKIDNKINQNINKILNNIIIKRDNIQNKIYFKNLLNEAIKAYAG